MATEDGDVAMGDANSDDLVASGQTNDGDETDTDDNTSLIGSEHHGDGRDLGGVVASESAAESRGSLTATPVNHKKRSREDDSSDDSDDESPAAATPKLGRSQGQDAAEERIREREAMLAEKEAELAKKEQDLKLKLAELERKTKNVSKKPSRPRSTGRKRAPAKSRSRARAEPVPAVAPPPRPQVIPYNDLTGDNTGGPPTLPFRHNGFMVHSLGDVETARKKYHSPKYIYPIGYAVTREYYSMKNPSQVCTYLCQIVDGGEKPLFKITCAEKRDESFTHQGPTGAWDVTSKRLGDIAGLKSTSKLSGPEAFGLADTTIRSYLQQLPGAHLLQTYSKAAPSLTADVNNSEEAMKCQDCLSDDIATDLHCADCGKRFHSPCVSNPPSKPEPEWWICESCTSSRLKRLPRSPFENYKSRVLTEDEMFEEGLSKPLVNREPREEDLKDGSSIEDFPPLENAAVRPLPPRLPTSRLPSQRENDEELRKLALRQRDVLESVLLKADMTIKRVADLEKQLGRTKLSVEKEQKKRYVEASKEAKQRKREMEKMQRARQREAEKERKRQKRITEAEERRQALIMEAERQKQERFDKRMREKEERERKKESARIQKEEDRKKREEMRLEARKLEKGIEDCTLDFDEKHILPVPTAISWLPPADIPTDLDRDSVFGDVLAIVEFFRFFGGLFAPKIRLTAAECIHMLFESDNNALRLANRIHVSLLDLLLKEDKSLKVEVTQWLLDLPLNIATFLSVCRLYLETHTDFVEENLEVVNDLTAFDYCALPIVTKIKVLRFLQTQALMSSVARDLMDTYGDKIKELEAQVRRMTFEQMHTRKNAASQKDIEEAKQVLGLKNQMLTIINAVINSVIEDRDLSAPFMALPEKELYQDYYKLITKPMSLDNVQTGINDGKYATLEALMEDIALVFNNATSYNQPGSTIYNDAKSLHEVGLAAYKKAKAIKVEVVTDDPKVAVKQLHKAQIQTLNTEMIQLSAPCHSEVFGLDRYCNKYWLHSEVPGLLVEQAEHVTTFDPPRDVTAVMGYPEDLALSFIREANKEAAEKQKSNDDEDEDEDDEEAAEEDDDDAKDEKAEESSSISEGAANASTTDTPKEETVTDTLMDGEASTSMKVDQVVAVTTGETTVEGNGPADAMDVDASVDTSDPKASEEPQLDNDAVPITSNGMAVEGADTASPMDVDPSTNEEGDKTINTDGDSSTAVSGNINAAVTSSGDQPREQQESEEPRSEKEDLKIEFLHRGSLPIVEPPPKDEKLAPNPITTKWCRYTTEEDVDKLIASLHPKGFRERRLREALQVRRDVISLSLQRGNDKWLNQKPNPSNTNFSTQLRASLSRDLCKLAKDLSSKSMIFGNQGDEKFVLSSWLRDVQSAETVEGFLVQMKKLFNHIDCNSQAWSRGRHYLATSLDAVQTFSEAALHLSVMDQSIVRRKPKTRGRKSQKDMKLPKMVSTEAELNDKECITCGDGGDLLCCDACPLVYHITCLDPPLMDIPSGEWKCPKCVSAGKSDYVNTGVLAEDDTCRVCHTGGILVWCDCCPNVYHISCLDPPLDEHPGPDENWFCDSCSIPRRVVWAKVKGYPFWPAKVMSTNGESCNLWFFGTYESAKLVKSKLVPYHKHNADDDAKNDEKLAAALEEVQKYVEKLRADNPKVEYPEDLDHEGKEASDDEEPKLHIFSKAEVEKFAEAMPKPPTEYDDVSRDNGTAPKCSFATCSNDRLEKHIFCGYHIGAAEGSPFYNGNKKTIEEMDEIRKAARITDNDNDA